MSKPVAVGFLFSLSLILGVILALGARQPVAQQTIEWLDNPRTLSSFHLEGETGEFRNQSLEGQWTVVLFGFLRCPDICPTSLSQMAALAERLRENSISPEVQFIFVSVDPQRDSVAAVDQYVRHFDAAIHGVTGSEEALGRLAESLGIQFKVSPGDDDYTVAHSITFSIIGPEGVLRGRFRPGFDVNNLVRSMTARFV